MKNRGIVTLIFILLMAVLATLILVVGQSRLLLAIQRSKSSSDNLITSYSAESEINDLLLRLSKGVLTQADFSSFPITKTLDEGKLVLEINGRIEGSNQILDVTARRSFAVSKIQAIRAIQTAQNITPVDLILMLDCTGSMGSSSGQGQTTTRMQELKKAALNFVQGIANDPNGDFINLGLGVFGTNAAWVTTASGQNITPTNQISFNNIIDTINTKFNSTRQNSSACLAVQDNTSIGSGFTFAQDYFGVNNAPLRKKVEIVITDGRPNTRIPYPACPPSISCPTLCTTEAENFLRCAITDTNTRWDVVNFGVRDPNITAYGVTVLNPASNQITQIFQTALGVSNYFNATTADQLTGILDSILTRIATSASKTIISRVIPLEEN